MVQLSPGVSIQETDLTNIIPSVSVSTGATAGQFQWGPVEEIVTIDNEELLTTIFGTPNDTNYEDFLSCSSFLAYASNLKIVRVVDEDGDSDTDGAQNASATDSASGTGQLIKNNDDYDTKSFTSSSNLWIAKYPGALGNSIGVAWCDTSGFNDTDSNGDYTWSWRSVFTTAPSTNEFHVVVYDADGKITGTQNTVLERFSFVSTVTTAEYFDGTSAYFKNKINSGSSWLWVGKTSLLTGTNDGVTLAGGEDGLPVSPADRQRGFALYQNEETVDISIVFAGGADTTTAKYIVDNIAETRKDCFACVSPMQTDTVGVALDSTKLSNVKATRTSIGTSSYAMMTQSHKYMYDRYNDVYRWVPLNGDMAGLLARTDSDFDPWFSPAGYNKGRIKNTIKLSFNPSKTYRDELYKEGINPVVIFPSEGPVLFGDKTLLTRPSAFDRINVRRLFIVLEKAIAKASKYQLFEQNDERTRARFVNMIEPYLRDVKGRRGIEDFRVVCDETNQTSDPNEFACDIYIRPIYSINFIKLNFIAVRSGVEFEEVVVTQ